MSRALWILLNPLGWLDLEVAFEGVALQIESYQCII